MRVGIQFSRTANVSFISHLDMQRCFSRALRRTGYSFKLSEGFNPHIVMSFASALPVGMETTGDYVEFALREERTDLLPFAQTLNACLPSGIQVLRFGELSPQTKKLMALVYYQEVEFFPQEEDKAAFFHAAGKLLSEQTHWIQKKTKKGCKEVDIIPFIKKTTIGDTAKCTLFQQDGASLSANALLAEIESIAGKDLFVRTVRRDLLTKDLLALSSLFVNGGCL